MHEQQMQGTASTSRAKREHWGKEQTWREPSSLKAEMPISSERLRLWLIGLERCLPKCQLMLASRKCLLEYQQDSLGNHCGGSGGLIHQKAAHQERRDGMPEEQGEKHQNPDKTWSSCSVPPVPSTDKGQQCPSWPRKNVKSQLHFY